MDKKVLMSPKMVSVELLSLSKRKAFLLYFLNVNKCNNPKKL